MASSSGVDYPLNFGQASSRDPTVYGVVRPGGQQAEGPFGSAVVDDWAKQLKAKGVTRVISLLDDSELSPYEEPLGELYDKHFKRCVLALTAAALTARSEPPLKVPENCLRSAPIERCVPALDAHDIMWCRSRTHARARSRTLTHARSRRTAGTT